MWKLEYVNRGIDDTLSRFGRKQRWAVNVHNNTMGPGGPLLLGEEDFNEGVPRTNIPVILSLLICDA